nr:MAG TPA: hypothetical protein [Caudoviricetes sp.]
MKRTGQGVALPANRAGLPSCPPSATRLGFSLLTSSRKCARALAPTEDDRNGQAIILLRACRLAHFLVPVKGENRLGTSALRQIPEPR